MLNTNDDSVANFNAWRVRQTASASDDRQGVAVISIGLAYIALLLAIVAAWVTHVVVCIQHAAWILLLFGCLVAPAGVVHGFGVWLGVF